MDAALTGIRVVDLTHLIAGPFTTMLLADAGADIIKVEPPTGDISRRRIPQLPDGEGPGLSGYFLAVNRGKKSIALDLKNPRGRALLDELLASADVLVENFRPGVLERLELGVEDLRERYPQLVIASISAFGKRNVPAELQDVPGLAIVAEAMSGLTAQARDSQGQPVWCGFPLGDFTAGLTCYSAVVTALFRRARFGGGSWLDISMADAMLTFNASSLASDCFPAEDAGQPQARTSPYGVYPANDGYVAIGVNSDVFWQRLCGAMDRPDIADDGRFVNQAARARNADIVGELVTTWTRTHTRTQLVDTLRKHGVPVSPVSDSTDVVNSALFASRGMAANCLIDADTSVFVPGSAQGYDVSTRVPRLGEDTEHILGEVLGLDGASISRARMEGAFGDR